MDSYTDRPWLARYPEGLPADIETEYPTLLEMFRASVRRAPDTERWCASSPTTAEDPPAKYCAANCAWSKPPRTARPSTGESPGDQLVMNMIVQLRDELLSAPRTECVPGLANPLGGDPPTGLGGQLDGLVQQLSARIGSPECQSRQCKISADYAALYRVSRRDQGVDSGLQLVMRPQGVASEEGTESVEPSQSIGAEARPSTGRDLFGRLPGSFQGDSGLFRLPIACTCFGVHRVCACSDGVTGTVVCIVDTPARDFPRRCDVADPVHRGHRIADPHCGSTTATTNRVRYVTSFLVQQPSGLVVAGFEGEASRE